MHHAAAEPLSSLSRCYEKPVRCPIACSPRPRNPVRGLQLSRPLRLRFRASGAFCASRSLVRDVPMDAIGTKTAPDVLCREDARGPFSAPATHQRGPPVAGHRSPVTGCGPRLTGHGARVTGRGSSVAGCWALHKSFGMRSCAETRWQVLWNVQLQIIGLKVSWNEQLQETPGG